MVPPLGPICPLATRPLAIQKNATWYTFGHDLTKNVTELYNTEGIIATTYDYEPYGAVTASGIDQPFQWSSEVYDVELALVYYNCRYYNPMDGRWISRDFIAEQGGLNLFSFVSSSPFQLYDMWGLFLPEALEPVIKGFKNVEGFLNSTWLIRKASKILGVTALLLEAGSCLMNLYELLSMSWWD